MTARRSSDPSGKPAPADDGEQHELFEAPAPSYLGHRARLRERFMQGGPDAMPDYEMLELILFRAIPRRDTEDLAERLLARFGSFAEVVNAPDALVKKVAGASDRVVEELRLIRAAALRLMQRQIIEKPALSSWSQVVEYCRAAMAYSTTEQFRILFSTRKPADCRRGAGRGHGGPHPRLCARGGEAGAGAVVVGDHSRPQSPVGRSDAVARTST